MHYDTSSELIWRAERRVCAPSVFSTYFRLSLDQDILPKKIIDELIHNSNSESFVEEFFRKQSKVKRHDGRSNVPLIFEELMGSAQRVPPENVKLLFAAIFKIVDELDLERDEPRGQYRDGNELRLHWLLNEFVRDRMPQSERNRLFIETVPNASFGWAIDLARRIYDEHWPRASDSQTAAELRFVDAETASRLMEGVLERIKVASESGELLRLIPSP